VTNEIGRWWGNNPKLRCQEEIDIITTDGNSGVFCDCRWENTETDIDVLNGIIEKSTVFHYKDKYYFLFSKSGFTEKCRRKAAESSNIRLFSFSDMFEFIE
jgi:hypothetical protein